jgi:hypothetical protein
LDTALAAPFLQSPRLPWRATATLRFRRYSFAIRVDFDEPGELQLFINESQERFLEDIVLVELYSAPSFPRFFIQRAKVPG